MQYWQIAAGSYGRDYSDRFIRHGLAFVGIEYHAAMAQIRPGDVIILKKGMSQIHAVGRAVERNGVTQSEGGKHWLYDFDGWELPAWCNVDWHKLSEPVFVSGLTRTTIQRVIKHTIIDVVQTVLSTSPKLASYDPEPAESAVVTEEGMITALVDFGLRPAAAEELSEALRRIRLLARFYMRRPLGLTKEHEARTFLVIPLLLALGWAEQRMQIEYAVPGVGRADIACFKHPVVKAVADEQENGCVLLIETKGLEQGLDYAPEQARGYANQFPSCEIILVTNGYCYKAYKREVGSGSFSLYPSAYLNLIDPRERYSLDPERVAGAIEVLKMLTPS